MLTSQMIPTEAMGQICPTSSKCANLWVTLASYRSPLSSTLVSLHLLASYIGTDVFMGIGLDVFLLELK